jgi:hypothetical protein
MNKKSKSTLEKFEKLLRVRNLSKTKLTHLKLCIKGANYLRSQGIHPFHRGQYSVCELERAGECPDAFAWGGGTTQLIEVKVSRSDFLSDKKKLWRKDPSYGLGRYRSYLCPTGLIKPEDIRTKGADTNLDFVITSYKKTFIK